MSHAEITNIIQLINLYGLAMDTQRWDLFDRIFTADVEADYGRTAHWHDLATFKADFAAFHAPLDATQHVMSNHLVHVDGDTAQAFTYGSWRLLRKAVDGNPLWDGTGWYDDALVRGAAGWRIRHRICRIVWWTGNPLVNETIPGVKFELTTTILRQDAEAGRCRFLNVIVST
ncbi:MAG TPA: nuclear transport factor 2 family protein [Acetobacteraceae bacterium]|nr:nuclear transport factor 2 family protein [Acetobacteraceae bacterium]